MTRDEFEKEKGLVKSLLRWFGVSRGRATASLSSYGNSPRNVFDFNTNRLLPEYDRLVDGSPQIGGNRRIDRAVEDAWNYFARSPANRPNILVLFVAGRQAREPGVKSLGEVTQPLKDLNVHVYVVAIGSGADSKELRPVVQETNDIATVSSFNRLWKIQLPLSKQIVEG